MTWSEKPANLGEALHVDRVSDGRGGTLLSHVRHPGLAWCPRTLEPTDDNLQTAACKYLAALSEALPELGPLPAVLQGAGGLRWLPLTWGWLEGLPDGADAGSSFLVARQAGGNWREATLVLLAARLLHGRTVGDGVGLRVTAHVTRPNRTGLWRLRFASVACSRIDRAAQPLPPALSNAISPQQVPTTRRWLEEALDVRHVAIHGLHEGPEPDVIVVDGLAVRVQEQSLDARQRRRPDGALNSRARVYGFTATLDVKTGTVTSQRLRRMAAGMGHLPLFERDGASMGPPATLGQRRPDHFNRRLDTLREWQVPVPATAVNPAVVPLADVAERFEVTHDSRAVESGTATVARNQRTAALPPLLQTLPDALEVLPLRSDDLAAAQAYVRGKALFDRLAVYGFDVGAYFRHARLPLVLRPRARLLGAEDGRAVNAEVRPYYVGTVPEGDLANPNRRTMYDLNKRPQLQVRFGAADVHQRNGAQHLGLAADPRWAWHEFGHVLNFAATGELEFGFAHSAGDALAAIAADPDSGLAVSDDLRGHTFPWAQALRRHDRRAMQGWCWCGRRNGLRLLPDPPLNQHRHGYFEEQLLSSSLFRLYLSLGGATGVMPSDGDRTLAESELVPPADTDLACRRSASDYCIYLIMRAIALLGSNRVVPTTTAELFVGALIDADLGTGQWELKAPWPYRIGGMPKVVRQGGRVHKVIRWAFQQQGLYATRDPSAVAEGEGSPPRGDVFIADRRPGAAGGYEPVPLQWDDKGEAPWCAHPEAISVGARGELTVNVQRVDSQPAQALSMRLWVGRAVGKTVRWQPVPAPRMRGASGFTADLGPWRGQSMWVLACADSSADRCNLGQGEPPPEDQAPLIELVAHDNNIGLAYVAV